MPNINKALIMLYLVVLIAVASCAGWQPLLTVSPAKGEAVVTVRVSSFTFEPNNIKAYQGSVLVFRMENSAGSDHNFTLKNPQGRILASVLLPSQKTVTVKVKLSEAGTYEFYCDKPLHATFGMTGRMEVLPAP